VKSGYSVTACLNGSNALDKLKEEVFDLMITDVRLPGIDGITLLQKATDLQSHMAVIVMTAYSEV
jgi:YesN/AraC family two-component response regulator